MRDTNNVVPKKVLRDLILLTGASAVALFGAPVLAQTADTAPQPADTAPAAGSGEIVVTAQKRSESIQHVPISMQALSPAVLEQHQVASFDDYAKQLPSVSFQSFGPGQSQLFFRGITSGGDGLAFGALPTSGVYVDEIPVTTIGALLDMHIYDMARIEALSGPQGTLFGASSLSGTLRMITNKPVQDKTEGSLDLTGDKYGKGSAGGTIEGMINLPVAHGVAVRAVGFYEHLGGYNRQHAQVADICQRVQHERRARGRHCNHKRPPDRQQQQVSQEQLQRRDDIRRARCGGDRAGQRLENHAAADRAAYAQQRHVPLRPGGRRSAGA